MVTKINRPGAGTVLVVAFAIAALLVDLMSAVPLLWLGSLAAFLFALIVLGWDRATPVLVFLIAINMFSIWADNFNIDLTEHGLGLYPVVRNQNEAILHSSAAMAILALGMMVGQQFKKGIRDGGQPANLAEALAYSPSRIAFLYFAFIPLAKIISVIGSSLPGVSAWAYTFVLLKFGLIYWLALSVFTANRQYIWLVGVLISELIVGSMGFYSDYKDGFFVVLIALAESKRRLPARQLVLALAGIIVIIYMSLIWTAVKPEYRAHIYKLGTGNSIVWLANKYADPNLASWHAASTLLARIGYTKFYAMVLDRDTSEFRGIYERAVESLEPRLLFPKKSALNDSVLTNAVLDWKINTRTTSIGLGYVAQAYIDFGFPGLLLPIFVLGTIVGAMYTYFLTRPAPAFLCKAFGVGCLFVSFRFETDIDKALGGLFIGFLISAITLHFGKSLLLRIAAREPRSTGAVPYSAVAHEASQFAAR